MGVLAVLSSLGERLALGSSLPRECWMRRCDYYTHYLAYEEPGEPSLSHDAYHAAAAKCDEAQEALMRWMDEHPDKDPLDDSVGRRLWRQAEYWERKIRA